MVDTLQAPATRTIRMPPLHQGQIVVRDSAARFRVLAAGRRWGKSRLGVALCVAHGLQGRRAWWIAPSYAIAEIGWRQVRGIARQIPGADIREGDRIASFPGGGFVQVRTGDNPDNLRGEGLDFVVLDEAAYLDRRVWTDAIRPALADRRGGALFISTPRGRNNWFHEIFRNAEGCTDGTWQAWRFHSVDNPHVSAEEIAEARRELAGAPDWLAGQEFDAEFSDNGGNAVFSGRVLDDIARAHCREPEAVGMLAMDVDRDTCRVRSARFVEDERGPLSIWAMPDKGRNYAIGADIGQGLDASNSVMAVVDVQSREIVAEFTSNRYTPEEFASQASALAQFYGGQLGVAYVAWESNNAGVFGKRLLAIGHSYVHWSQDELSQSPHRSRVPGWSSNPQSKLALIADMRGAMARGEFIPHGLPFIEECREYIFSPSWVPMPAKSVDKPEGERKAHGDRVIAYAVAWLASKCQPKATPPPDRHKGTTYADLLAENAARDNRREDW